jgi:deoxycytidine triphosphate deaminase
VLIPHLVTKPIKFPPVAYRTHFKSRALNSPAQIGDEAIYWDENNKQVIVSFNEKNTVEIKPNSLVFFRTKQVFRLPSYMAIRFNLRITNVHRGLLLGTGPLVDPGFEGDLLVPIHNLTNNSYYFKGGDKFIWVEFTKVSSHRDWGQTVDRVAGQSGKYEPFPKDKVFRTPRQYFENAYNNAPIKNATPAALDHAEKLAKRLAIQVNVITVGGVSIAAGLILAGVYVLLPLAQDSVALSASVSSTISEFRAEYQAHLANEVSSKTKIEALDRKFATINKISGQQNQLDALEQKIDALQKEIDRYKASPTRQNPSRQNPK